MSPNQNIYCHTSMRRYWYKQIKTLLKKPKKHTEIEPPMKPNYNIESTYYIELPKWERKPAQEAKSRQPPNEEDGLQTDPTGFGWTKTEHLQVRTLGHFAFWKNPTPKKENYKSFFCRASRRSISSKVLKK
jgi:hypothetical protein